MKVITIGLLFASITALSTAGGQDKTPQERNVRSRETLGLVDAEQKFAIRALVDAIALNEGGNTSISAWSLYQTFLILHAATDESSESRANLARLLAGNSEFRPSLLVMQDDGSASTSKRWQLPFGLRDNDGYGVRVLEIPGSDVGVRTGDLIFTANGRPLKSIDDVARLIEDSGVEITIEGYDVKTGRPFSRRITPVDNQSFSSSADQPTTRNANLLWLRKDIQTNSVFVQELEQTDAVSIFRTKTGFDGEFQTSWKELFAKSLGPDAVPAVPRMPADAVFGVFCGFTADLGWTLPFRNVGAGLFRFENAEDAEFLVKIQRLRYFRDEQFDLVELTFDSTDTVCRLVLLKTSDMRMPTLRKDGSAILNAISVPSGELKDGIVEVVVPRFAFESHYSLRRSTLRGVSGLFEAATDLSRLSPNVRLASFENDVRLAFDADKFRVSALTKLIGVGLSAPPVSEFRFLADRPFLFSLQKKDGLVLAMGFVRKPTTGRALESHPLDPR